MLAISAKPSNVFWVHSGKLIPDRGGSGGGEVVVHSNVKHLACLALPAFVFSRLYVMCEVPGCQTVLPGQRTVIRICVSYNQFQSYLCMIHAR